MTERDAQEHQRRVEVADVRRMMNKREGRRFMWRLLSLSGPFTVPAAAGAETVNFENGRRVIGTTLMMEIFTACPETFALMQSEARQDAEHLDQLRKRADGGRSDRNDD